MRMSHGQRLLSSELLVFNTGGAAGAHGDVGDLDARVVHGAWPPVRRQRRPQPLAAGPRRDDQPELQRAGRCARGVPHALLIATQ
jgi:hypothetical protein